jgi:outer membrane protein assembly factor BamB
MVLSGGWETNYQTFDGLAETNVPQQLFSVVPSTGAVAWTVNLPVASAAQQNSGYGGVGDATVGNSCPAIATDGTVYVGNFDGLHAIVGATGAEKSGFPFATSSVVLTAPAIGGDGTIFFGTADGTFYAVNPDGSQRFTVHAGGRIAGSPAIGPDGTVYFTANDGYLYAVQ